MASSFARAEQAAHGYRPTVQFRKITDDELQTYLCSLTNPHVSIAITSFCWKGNILQQTGVKYPAAEEEAGSAAVRASVNEGRFLLEKKIKSSHRLTGLGPDGQESPDIFILRDQCPECILLSSDAAFSIPNVATKERDTIRCFLSLIGQN